MHRVWWAIFFAAFQLTPQPDDVSRHSAAASAAMRRGDYAAAEQHNRALLELAPQLAEAHINLGLSCFAQRKYAEAVKAFEEGLKLKPELGNGLLFLGISWFNLNRLEEAIPALEKYSAARADDLQGHYYLGLSLMGLERFRAAVTPLSRATQIDPLNIDVLYHLAAAYLGQAREPASNRDLLRRQYEAILQKIVSVDPKSHRIAQLRAGYYQANGESLKARDELERLVARNPKIRGIHYTLGCMYLESREYEKASEQFQAELLLDAPHARTYLQLAHALIELGGPSRALPLLEQARQAEPSSGVPWVETARAYRALNRPHKAAEAYQKAIDLGERKANVYYQLAIAYRSIGKTKESDEAFRLSRELRGEEVVSRAAQTDEAALVDEAKEALSSGRYAEAARGFEQVWLTSSRCDVPFYLGLAEQRGGNANKALIAFHSAVKCSPGMLAAHLALAETYAEKGDDNRALAAYEGALKVAPDNPPALRGAAGLYMRHQMNERAVVALETLVNLERGNVQAIEDLGAAFAATSRFDEAEQQFRAALRLNPYLPSALTGLANVTLMRGKVDEAIDLLSKAAELAPDAYEPKYVLGSAYAQAGRYQEAASALEGALKAGRADAETYYRLAGVYQKLGRDADRRSALAEFSRRKAETDRTSQIRREVDQLVLQAQAAINSGDLKTAAAVMEKAVAVDPGNPHSLFRLAGVYYDLGRYDDARERVQSALEGAPGEWSYYYLLGLVEKKSGNSSAARASLTTALRLNHEAVEVRTELNQLGLGSR